MAEAIQTGAYVRSHRCRRAFLWALEAVHTGPQGCPHGPRGRPWRASKQVWEAVQTAPEGLEFQRLCPRDDIRVVSFSHSDTNVCHRRSCLVPLSQQGCPTVGNYHLGPRPLDLSSSKPNAVHVVDHTAVKLCWLLSSGTALWCNPLHGGICLTLGGGLQRWWGVGDPQQPTTPHHTTPHRTAPHHTTPHHTTPHHTTPHHTTPHHTTPHHTTPHHTTPHHTTPHHTTPHHTTPHHTALHRTGSRSYATHASRPYCLSLLAVNELSGFFMISCSTSQ